MFIYCLLSRTFNFLKPQCSQVSSWSYKFPPDSQLLSWKFSSYCSVWPDDNMDPTNNTAAGLEAAESVLYLDLSAAWSGWGSWTSLWPEVHCSRSQVSSPTVTHHVEAGPDNIDLVKCLHFIKKSFNFGSALPRLERQAADMPPSLIGPNEALYLNQNIRLTRMIRRMLLLSIMWQLGGYQRTKERFVEYKIRSVDFSIRYSMMFGPYGPSRKMSFRVKMFWV